MKLHPYAPIIGQWYQNLDTRSLFEVVANGEDTVEIQFFDGEIDAVDEETWQQLPIHEIPPPEDASGPFEFSPEDLDNFSDIIHDPLNARYDAELDYLS